MTVPRFPLVAFDCDSTLCAIEGIDELAAGHREAVAELTDAAMRGEIPLEAVYSRRLELIRPDRQQVDRLAGEYVRRLVPDARAVIRALMGAGVDVRIMSGGLLPAVAAVAAALGLPGRAVAAVGIRFDDAGNYAGFEEDSPLTRSGGKRTVLDAWRREAGGRTMLVGDGITDAEAGADVFVAYAGVAARAAVLEAADVVIRGPSLAPVLPLALSAPPDDAEDRAVYQRGLELLDGSTTRRVIQ